MLISRPVPWKSQPLKPVSAGFICKTRYRYISKKNLKITHFLFHLCLFLTYFLIIGGLLWIYSCIASDFSVNTDAVTKNQGQDSYIRPPDYAFNDCMSSFDKLCVNEEHLLRQLWVRCVGKMMSVSLVYFLQIEKLKQSDLYAKRLHISSVHLHRDTD